MSLAERMGCEEVASGLVFDTPRKRKKNAPEMHGDFIEDLSDEDEEILESIQSE